MKNYPMRYREKKERGTVPIQTKLIKIKKGYFLQTSDYKIRHGM